MSGFYTPGLPQLTSTNTGMPLSGSETYPVDTNKSQGLVPETGYLSGAQMGAIGLGPENNVSSAGASTGTISLDCTLNSFFRVQLGATSCTLLLTNPSPGQLVEVELDQDGTGSRTITAYATRLGTLASVAVKWNGGTAPTLTTAASAIDVVAFRFGLGNTTASPTLFAQGRSVGSALA